MKRARDFRAGWQAARTHPDEASYQAALADYLGDDAMNLPDRVREGPPANQMALFDDAAGGPLLTVRPAEPPREPAKPKRPTPAPFLSFIRRT